MKKIKYSALIVSLAFIGLSSCSKQKPPTALIDMAEEGVKKFESSYDNPKKMTEYSAALTSLETAKKAVEDKKYGLAKSEAKLSMTNIKLAEEKIKRSGTESVVKTLTAQNSKLMDKNSKLMSQLSFLEAKKTLRGVEFTLKDMMFEFGKAELKAGAKDKLAKLAKILNEDKTRNILIEGHTDSVGSDAFNMKLSHNRGLSVKAYLISNNIDLSRLDSKGMGEKKPVAPNDTEAGRQQNRRVEVTILNK